MSGTRPSFWLRARVWCALLSTVPWNLKGLGLAARTACAPAMNCHGCPWATCACPVGVASFGSAMHALPALAIGTVLAIGVAGGRLACAFLCPFGVLQDLLHRIPGPRLRLPGWIGWGKYLALALLVVALPWLTGLPVPGFIGVAKPQVDKSENGLQVTVAVSNPSTEPVIGVDLDLAYRAADGSVLSRHPQHFPDLRVEPGATATLPVIAIPNRLAEGSLAIDSPQARIEHHIPLTYYCATCPVGTLESMVLPGALGGGLLPSHRNLLRFGILVGFLLLMWVSRRPFCRAFCPLGAAFACTSRVALTRIELDADKCTQCGACRRVCPQELDPTTQVTSPECIQCGDCIAACPGGGFRRRFGFR